jgi:predicted DNA repair protein MutK
MKAFIDRYGIWLGGAVLIATVVGVVLTKSNPYLCTWLFLLGALAMFLVKRNNPDLGSNIGG